MAAPIFYNALLLTGVNLLLRLISTGFQVYLSGQIGAAGIGLLQLVLSVGSMAMTAGIAGIRTATMYLTAEELGKKRSTRPVLRVCGIYSLIASGMVGTVLYIAAPAITDHWISDPAALGAVRLFAVFLPVVCMTGVMTGHFTAANQISTLAAVEVVEQLCSMGITVGLLTLWAGTDAGRACQSVVLGSSLGAVVTLSCLVILKLRQREDKTPATPLIRRLLDTAVPLALADDLKAGISTTENLMVPQRLALYPAEVEPLAAFGTVCGMVFPVLMFPASILYSLADLLIPELARCAAAGSRNRIQYLVKRSLRVAMVYGVLCGGLLYLLSDWLCDRLYSSQEAGMYLRWYALLAPMLYCDAITDAMTKGLGQQRACVRYNILTSGLDVLFLYLLLPKYGMGGYFLSFLVTHLLNFLLSLRRLLKIAGNRIPFYIPTLTISATLMTVWAAGHLSSPGLRATAFGLLLGCSLFLLRILRREDISWLKGLVFKK